MDCAYKLQEYAGRPSRKRSEGKATWPGRKQVYRERDQGCRILQDTLTLASAPAVAGQALLRPVMRGGKRLSALPTLTQAREYAATQLRELPDPLRSLDPALPYPVIIAEELKALRDQVDAASAIAQHRP